MRRNGAFVAKFLNTRLTKIFMAIFAPEERLPSSATLAHISPYHQYRQWCFFLVCDFLAQSIWNFGLFGQSCLFSSTKIRPFQV